MSHFSLLFNIFFIISPLQVFLLVYFFCICFISLSMACRFYYIHACSSLALCWFADPVSTTGVFSAVSSVLTSSCSTGISSYAGSDSGAYHHPLGSSYSTRKYGSTTNKSFDDTKKSLDDQLKELDSQLDSQLLSKVGMGPQANAMGKELQLLL